MGSEPSGGGLSSYARHSIFGRILSLENLFAAWKEFKRGKGKKQEVQEFEFQLEDNIFQLHEELCAKTYRHGPYSSFYVRDPKLRHIHKAMVRDRLLHQAVFRVLYNVFDRQFIHDSYSCRFKKGTHAGVGRLKEFMRKASKNFRKPVYALKCDIKKFFFGVNHQILLRLVERAIDIDTQWIVKTIVKSFESEPSRGLPLGNVTSQLFANIYLNELDQFIKYALREKYYVRYCDDFIIVHESKSHLVGLVKPINTFLNDHLGLKLHPDKISVRKLSYGIDFLGYVALPDYAVIRIKTKKRVMKRIVLRKEELSRGLIGSEAFECSLQSYLGLLAHCNGYKLSRSILDIIGQ